MHPVRNSNRRKMLKPKFCSSSSDDDNYDDAEPLKWKPIIATFPSESNAKPTNSHSIQSNMIIDSLNAKMSQQTQQKLSAEIIQKEEIYNQAEMEANRKMFGCVNPGRCLSKDEIQRRKDIILGIVNERLKSKLSELMGEFGERIQRNDTYDDSTSRNRSSDDDDCDSLPEAPPPPTFNTSSESECDDLDISMTKEFELYEKEIQEKSANVLTRSTPTTSSTFSLSASYNSVQICPATAVPSAQIPIHQQTSSNYQQNWRQPLMQQWPMTDQSVDLAPWIPPVGPPQVMDPFPPPIESEQMFTAPPPHFPIFPNANPTAANGWMNPSWTHPPPTTASSNYAPGTQYSNTEWINRTQSAPQRPQMHSISSARQAAPRMNCNAGLSSIRRPNAPIVRPNSTIINSLRNQVHTSSNVNVSIVSQSTFVNAILAAEQNVAPSTSVTETKENINHINSNATDAGCRRINRKSPIHPDSNALKRPCEQKMDKIECATNANGNTNANRHSDEIIKRTRVDDTKVKKTRFDSPKHDHNQPEYRLDCRNASPPEPMQLNEIVRSRKTPEFDTRHAKTNAKTLKFLSKFRNAKNGQTTATAPNSMMDDTIVPMEWTELCDIVDKLLDLSPNSLNGLPITDRRVKERNELLMLLSGDPDNLYGHVDQYGEQNVKWAVKAAQRILFPQGRYNDSIAVKIAPFQKAIHVALNTDSIPSERQPMSKNTAKVSVPTKQEARPKEWMKLCKIVDELLNIPTRIIESLPPSDSRVKERNDILMMLSNEPEDFLLHDEKYGALHVDWAILSAKKILNTGGVRDERVRKIMLRQRDKLKGGSTDRSISRDRESRKNANHTTNEHRSRSLPKEWSALCEIVDKVLDTPKEVRVKMSKRDPRWEQRENILLVLSDDPDKLAAQSDALGPVNVDWAIKLSKRILFPNGSRDRTVFKKLSPQRKLILRNRPLETLSDAKVGGIEASKCKNVNGELRKTGDDQSTNKQKAPQVQVEKIKAKKPQENQSLEVDKSAAPKRSTKEPQSSSSVIAADPEIDENEVWVKLCSIVDKLLDLPPNAADKLKPSDKRLIERNDILMILSDDPENFTKFDASYGSAMVGWAIKSAKKLIYSNGKPNEKLTDALWKQRDAIICSEDTSKGDQTKDATNSECNEWKCIRKIATKVFLLSGKGIEKQQNLTKEQRCEQIELLLQLSADPDSVRSTSICRKMGDGRVEGAIAKCKHILNRMRKLDPKALANFDNLRSQMVVYAESLNQSKSIKNYDVILADVRKIVNQKLFKKIFGQNCAKWTKEQIVEQNEFAILLIKDPHFLRSNAKYSEMVRQVEKSTVDEIVSEVEKCLRNCEYVKEKPAVVCAPIIAKIKDVKYMNPFKERKLTMRIHRLIEQFLIAPKPEIFDVHANETDGTVDVVCANVMTYDWLSASIRELDGLWSNAELTICRALPTRKILRIDDLKEIQMAFKTVPTESFAVIMRQLKKANPKLNTERWQSNATHVIGSKRMPVMVDLESLIELERSKREISVEGGPIYFDIRYIGKENFKAEC